MQLCRREPGGHVVHGTSISAKLKQWQVGIAEIEEVLRLDPDNAAASRALYIAKKQAEAESKPVKP
jgi:hypothetical protein